MQTNLRKKFNSFKRQPLFLKIQLLCEKLPYSPIEINKLFVLEFKQASIGAVRGFGQLRAGSPNDLEALCVLDNKPEVFQERFDVGDSCVVAMDDEQIIGYEWMSIAPYHTEQRWQQRIEIPRHSVYGYDCFILPAYRLRGTWLLMQQYKLEFAQMCQRSRLMSCIDFGNTPSFKAHLRLGYELKESIIHFRLLNNRHAFCKEIDHQLFDLQSLMV